MMQGVNRGGGGSQNDFELRKAQTTKFMREKVIAVDEKDAQVWSLITDVPKLGTPWQYVCFVLNVIIPGKLFVMFIV